MIHGLTKEFLFELKKMYKMHNTMNKKHVIFVLAYHRIVDTLAFFVN